MCGIYGVINDSSNKAAQHVLEGLKKLEYRGYDSWGIAEITENSQQILIDKHIGKIGQATTDLASSSIAFGHTRWATHGGVTDINAHPHVDCTQKIAVIHNGIVENYQEIKEELREKGHKFTSDTDTEVIAHLIEEELKTIPFTQAVFNVFNQLIGSNAIGVLHLDTQSMVVCRNGSPLVIGLGEHSFYLASDVTAFLDKTNSVYFMNDGEGVELKTTSVKLYDLATGEEKTLTPQTIDWKVEDAEKGGYPHFLLKEIYEQKKTITKTALINELELKKIAAMIQDGYTPYIIGCGTAFFCASAAQYFFARQGIATQVYGAYEFLPFAQFCNEKSIVIAISQSGETADTLIAVREAKKKGAHIVALMNARGSTLERIADTVLPVSAGPEIAVVSTKAYTSQLATLYLLASAAKNEYDQAKKDILTLEKTLETWLSEDMDRQIRDLAKQLLDHEDIYLIGKYINYPAALEFSLKIKETSYIHSEAFASGELKHGVITLVQKETPCIVLTAADNIRQEVLSSAAELKARGGTIIGISPFKAEEFDYHIQTPELDQLSIFPNVIVGQLLSYYLGIGRGADPDKPRNLAKSVTVK